MATVCLRKFLVSVPAVAGTDSVAQAWEVFRQNDCEQVVVLDKQRYPMGVLRLLRLLPYISERGSETGLASQISEGKRKSDRPLPRTEIQSETEPLPPSLQQSLEQLRQSALAQGQPFLDSLTLLPADQRVNQLTPHLAQVHQQYWGILDANQRFLGLVDRLSLLHFLSNQTPPLHQTAPSQQPDRSIAKPDPKAVRDSDARHIANRNAGVRDAKQDGKKRDSKTGVKTVEEQWQASGTASRQSSTEKLTGKPNISKSAPLKQPPPDPLVELLERLPVPLMLQTATGQVITQNLAWRQQVGELRDPQQVRRDAALVLESRELLEQQAAESQITARETERVLVEMEPASLEGTPAATPQGSDPPPSELRGNHDWETWNAAASQLSPDADATGLCRIGTMPHACVCLCPMKNGQERIWQFMKVAMGKASQSTAAQFSQAQFSQNVIETAASWELDAQANWVTPFQLATLSFNPDPNWYWLNQTESLWLVLAQDITEQQQVAKELAAKNADLVQLNRLKDEFLACISHELKTPLTAVLGLSSLLKDQALGTLNNRQARYVQLIYQSGRHLIQIVNNILDLTRIETGQLDLLPEPVAIAEVCQRAYEQACQLQMVDEHTDSALPHHPPVRFTLDIQSGLHNLVADELRLRQMLTNLLSNAIKFTPPDGEIGLRVEAWEGWLAFTTWDTGIGIPAEKQHLIFQKFQQLESPMTRRFEGTGLGLVLTQRLARLHGGDVTFTSQEGQGSEFTLLLPPSPPQMLPPFRTPGLAWVRRNRLAIVIEADTLAVEAMTHQLIGLGYRAAIARSGTEALEKIRRLQPGIIFLNPILPLLSGWDVLTLLKADPETRHIPVVITAMRVQKELAYQNGADGFLNLPIQISALQTCLDRLVAVTAAAVDRSQPNLTVLYFNPGQGQQPAPLAHKLHQHQCRVLEVEDLEQAELLARVWKPDVLLLDGNIPDPATQLHQLSQSSCLVDLPLITLTVAATEAANQLSTLRVFPCLSGMWNHAWNNADELANSPLTDLLQVIQVAAGINWTPHILIVDCSQFEVSPALEQSGSAERTVDSESHLPKLPHTPQTIAQYLQIAGLHSTVAQAWPEVLHQLRHHSVNLLLFCVYHSHTPALLSDMAQELAEIPGKPPILVWRPQAISVGGARASLDADSTLVDYEQFAALWRSIAPGVSEGGAIAEILPDGLSVADLLERLQQILCQSIGS